MKRTKTTMRTGWVLVVWAASLTGSMSGSGQTPQQSAEPVQVVVPAGDYALLRAQVEGMEAELFVPFRDGKGRVAHPLGITREAGWLQVKDDQISGQFVSSAAAARPGREPARLVTAVLRATLRGGEVAGTLNVDGKARKLTGTWRTEAQLAADNPLAPERSWPAWTGPIGGGTAAEPTGVKLVESLEQARLIWRSEEAIGTNMGSINRFMQNWGSAMGQRTSGQSASPILGDGRIFLHQRVPAGKEFSLTSRYGGFSKTTMEEVKAAGFDEIPWYAMEKYLLQADEVVVAIDARSGKTLWKTILPLRAPNVQYHKDRGGDRTPVYVGGKFVGLTYNGGLFCLDGATGRLLWENPPAGKSFNPALAAIGEVVIAPGRGVWAGYDLATGKELWKAPGRYTSTTVAIWNRGDQPHVLIPIDKVAPNTRPRRTEIDLHCIEARSGKVVWSMPFAMGSQRLGMTVVGDTLVAFEKLGQGAEEAAGDESEKFTAGQVCAYRLSARGAARLWSVPLDLHPYTQPIVLGGRLAVAIGHDYSKSQQKHKVIDLATGKVLSATAGQGPANGGYAQAMEDLVLVRRDGTHGRIEFAAYRVSEEGQIVALEPRLWSPPGPHTTSYHHPVMYPLAEGRMFVRQADGIYCYDLRAGQSR